MDRGRDAVPTWDGEPAGWNTYVRRVRLQWERTASHKKKLLGAELASRLTGRAWDVSGDLDHARLQTRHGPVYLLEYLEQRLGRTPIPDLGSRLEEFLVRLRRQPGTRMVQWAADLRESYRRLQRALARARGGQATSGRKREAKASGSTPSSLQLPLDRRRSDTTAEPEPMDADHEPSEGRASDPPVANERTTGSRAASRTGEGGWTAEEWEQWWNSNRTWSPTRRRWRDDNSSEDDGPEPEWERFQLDEIDVLPPEVLGWLLLRRAHLPAHARLAVLAATNNRLELDLVEKAMRDQEEDLLQADDRRGPRRSYWVESGGEWGLLMDDPYPDENLAGRALGRRPPPGRSPPHLHGRGRAGHLVHDEPWRLGGPLDIS